MEGFKTFNFFKSSQIYFCSLEALYFMQLKPCRNAKLRAAVDKAMPNSIFCSLINWKDPFFQNPFYYIYLKDHIYRKSNICNDELRFNCCRWVTAFFPLVDQSINFLPSIVKKEKKSK